LGCDVIVGGITGVTLAALYKHLLQLQTTNHANNLYELIINYYVSVSDDHSTIEDHFVLLPKYVDILVVAFLYKPENFWLSLESAFIDTTLFIQASPPNNFHEYCRDYARNNRSNIIKEEDNTNIILCCVGPGTSSNIFLGLVQHNSCLFGNATICRHCTFESQTYQQNINIKPTILPQLLHV
jgi:hypothetical protein